jgi:hypothetical protein
MWFLLVASFLVASLSLSQAPSDITWSFPIQISHDSVTSTLPKIAVSGDTIHVVWFGFDTLGTIEQDGIQYSRSTDSGVSFSLPQTLLPFEFLFSDAKIALSQEHLYIVASGIIDTFSGTFLLLSTDAGATWQSPIYLQSLSHPLLMTAQDSLVFVHTFNFLTNSYCMLRSADYGLTWNTRTNAMPKLDDMVYSRKALHGVGRSASRINEEIGYYYSPNDGINWATLDFLSAEDVTRSNNGRIAANERGHLFVVWSDTGTVVTRSSRNNGGSWTPSIVLSSDIGTVITSVSASKEFVAAAWDKDVSGLGGINLRSSNDYAQTYFPINTPVTGSTAREPNVVFSGNRLHVVWQEEINGNVEIFYRQGLVEDNPDLVSRPPKAFLLRQNFPNPFNGTTRIEYNLPVDEAGNVIPHDVTLELYNILGQRVKTVFRQTQPSGRYVYYLEAADLPTGMYLYRIFTPQISETKKLIIVR